MILANKNGWMISVQLFNETETHYMVVPCDDKDVIYNVGKNETNRKLFDYSASMDEIISFIEN
ncbi:hypothetical protein VmeM32_00043 [Vibrio phage vB_VmeM-32]|nr:hypothetical protein VmeM32_00043 [Vibrio phage vB_VmeM-32]